MTNLYEITKEMLILSELGDESLTDDEIAARLGDLQIERDEKLASICGLIKNIEGDAEKIKAEEVRLKEKRERCERRVESIEKWLKSNLAPGEKWKDSVHSIGWRKSESVVPAENNLMDNPVIPMEYQKVTVAPDKAAMKKDLKAGMPIAGWKLEEKQNIQIK